MSIVSESALRHGRDWTAEEFLAAAEDPAWLGVELIDGGLHVSPFASLAHQRACARLAALLTEAVRGQALEVFACANVQLSATSVPVPDIVVCTAGLAGLAVPAADVVLVVEVESPSTRKVDRLVKPAAYAEAGIRHYWRADLDVPAIHVYRLSASAEDQAEYDTVAGSAALLLTDPFRVVLRPAELVM